MNVRPLEDRVLIKPLEAEERTSGGIVLPDTAKEKQQRGSVVAVGSGKLLENGERAGLSVKAGDTVVFGINPQDSASHRKFIDRYNFPFPLLVDREKRVVSAYGCRGALMGKRTVYGINKEGIIVFARRGMPSNKEILAAFRK